MSYAQKDYAQTQGINGRYSIASIGCFVTAFCNLVADYGHTIDPPTLDNFFRDNDIYIDIDDGVRDDLGWDSIRHYDSDISVGHTSDHGTDRSAGWPSTNQSIVRFYYQSISNPTLANGRPNMITHFCKVYDYASSLIVDSWDGQVKKSPYGEPTAWAEYNHAQAPQAPPSPPADKYQVVENYPNGKQIQLNKQPTNLWGMNYDFDYMKDHPVEVHNQGEIWTVTNRVHHNDGYDYYRRDGQIDGFNVADCDDYTPPPPPPPAAPLPIPTDTSPYTVVKTILGFTTSDRAANHANASTTVADGVYYIFNRRYVGDRLVALNVTKTPGKAGSWINPDDNVPDPIPEPVVLPVSDWSGTQVGGTTETTSPVPPTDAVPVTVAPNWRESYKAFKQPVLYIATRDFALHDIEQTRSAASVHEDDRIWMAGTFSKDNKVYARPLEAIRGKDKAGNSVERRWWFGEALDSGNIELASDWDTQTTLEERQVLHRLTTADYLNQYKEEIENALVKVWDIFIAPFSKKK